jgi:hypothetical protein
MSKHLISIALCMSLSACAYLPSVKNKLYVHAVENVPCGPGRGSGKDSGSVVAPTEAAEGFVVIVGWKRWEEITNPAGTGNPSMSEKIARFRAFATKEVSARGLCRNAVVPEECGILGWEGSGDSGLYVVCADSR